MFALLAIRPDTGYYTFAWLFAGMGVFSGLTYTPWMAGFTETVERRNPAATATGLAVWGGIQRVVIAVSAVLLPIAVTSVTPIVEHASEVQSAQAKAGPALDIVDAHPQPFAELTRYPSDEIPPDLQARAANEVGPADLAVVQRAQPQLRVLEEHGAEVADAVEKGPGQWRNWWFVCMGGQILFLPFVFVMRGRWGPRRAREEAEAHQLAVDRELSNLSKTA